MELALRGISFDAQAPLKLIYKGNRLVGGRVDLIADRRVAVELKAVDRVTPVFRATVRTYLRPASLHLGLLINFNVARLADGISRIICS